MRRREHVKHRKRLRDESQSCVAGSGRKGDMMLNCAKAEIS